jgi:hypothetical protein
MAIDTKGQIPQPTQAAQTGSSQWRTYLHSRKGHSVGKRTPLRQGDTPMAVGAPSSKRGVLWTHSAVQQVVTAMTSQDRHQQAAY